MSEETSQSPSEENLNKIAEDVPSDEAKETEEIGKIDVRPKEIVAENLTEDKIELILKPVSDAPIMKQKKWVVPATRTVGWINSFVRKYLKLTVDDSLFIYVNQSFAPQPDHSVRSLFDCFGSDGKLVLHYSKSQAWG